jgi:hypothetical protein
MTTTERPYTQQEIFLITQRVRELRGTGNTQQGLALRARFLAGEKIEPWEYSPTHVTPEIPVTSWEDLEHPPFTGPGSTAAKWRVWATTVTDIEADVLESMGRVNIVDLLRDRGVLPPLDLDDE